MLFKERITEIFEYGRRVLNNIKRSHCIIALYLMFIIILLILFSYSYNKIKHDEIGDYDWAYFKKDKIITKDNEQIGKVSITGIIRSKEIISPKNPAELKIFEIDFYIKKEIVKDYCGDNIICRDKTNATVCLEGFNARGYNESESVNYTWERKEIPCTEKIILKGDDFGEQILYSNESENSKKIVFMTSGPQTLRFSSQFYGILIEDAFEVKPYSNYLELQLNKYVFILTFIGSIVVILQIIDFGLKIYDRLGKQQK